MLLTKRGKPLAMHGPAPAEPSEGRLPGLLSGENKTIQALGEPLDVTWEALIDPSSTNPT